MLNFVVCDDNISILNRLSDMLESIFLKNDFDARVSFKSSHPIDILNYVEKNEVDVLILDINLKSKLNGCDIANIVRKNHKDIYIIFSTGHLEYALIAYKYKTFDYLTKPIVYEKLEETISRLIEDTHSKPTTFIKLNNNKTIIKQNEINYIKKDGMKLVFCSNTRNYETYGSFNKIQSCLPDNFMRCHKSFIANIENISNVDFSKNIIIFSPNISCAIGTKYKQEFLEVLKNGNF